jgi:hypothetical protein
MTPEGSQRLEEWAVAQERKRMEAYLGTEGRMAEPVETIRISFPPSVGSTAADAAAALIATEAERSLAFLRELADHEGSKYVRDRAKRDLARYERRLDVQQDSRGRGRADTYP